MQVAEDNGDARRLYERCGFRMQRHTGDDPLQFLRRPILRAVLGFPAWLRMRKALALPHFHANASAAQNVPAPAACAAGSERPLSICDGAGDKATIEAESGSADAASKSRTVSILVFQPGHSACGQQSAGQDLCSIKLSSTAGSASSCKQLCLAAGVKHAAKGCRARTACKRCFHALHLYLLLACR